MLSLIEVIQGESFSDSRGEIYSLNHFRFEGVQRMYTIHHSNIEIIRGWHGHQFEKKWFYCIQGSFTLAFVKPDDWENPAVDLDAEVFHLTSKDSKIICVPEGFANCIKASEPDSILLVLSGKFLDDALLDSWRYDSSLWVDWSKY